MEEQHWWFLGKRHIIKTLLASLPALGKPKLVVDVGCGPGGNVGALADTYDVVGIDTSPDAIALARQRYPGVRFWQGELGEAPPEIDDGTSFYLMTDVLEHVPDDFLLLSTLLARCRQGAHILLTVPANDALWSSHDEVLGHFRRYDRSQLELVWQGLPVTPLLLSYYNTRLYPVIRLVRALNRYGGKSFGHRGTDLYLPPDPVNRLLASLFAGESRVLKDCLEGRRPEGYRYGASLIAILRVDGPGIVPRHRPNHLDFDHAPLGVATE
jgi:SAM-dependent methyltransferase